MSDSVQYTLTVPLSTFHAVDIMAQSKGVSRTALCREAILKELIHDPDCPPDVLQAIQDMESRPGRTKKDYEILATKVPPVVHEYLASRSKITPQDQTRTAIARLVSGYIYTKTFDQPAEEPSKPYTGDSPGKMDLIDRIWRALDEL